MENRHCWEAFSLWLDASLMDDSSVSSAFGKFFQGPSYEEVDSSQACEVLTQKAGSVLVRRWDFIFHLPVGMPLSASWGSPGPIGDQNFPRIIITFIFSLLRNDLTLLYVLRITDF